jgi:[protein-PII] uridylyltransferase
LLKDLWHAHQSGTESPALIAVGGYGRGELNPYSDIDIMFLCRSDRERDKASPHLYALWDAGLDIGYSVRTVSECIELARTDSKVRTSLLESRLLGGDPKFYEDYLKRVSAEIFYWKIYQYIAEKIAERNAMRQKYGGSLYLREPNIKESSGGLRDFHTALWIARTRFRISSFPELVTMNVISAEQLGRFLKSRNFLWRLRNEIHYRSGRKNDHLTYDIQESAALAFHYRNSVQLLAVERLMKSYFLHARNILDFADIITERALHKHSRAWFERKRTFGSFTIIGRTLLHPADDLFRNQQEALLEAFALYQNRHVVFSDRMRQEIRDFRVGDEMRNSQKAAVIFLSILDNPDRLAETLTLMRDLKFLGKYIPEFRTIQALARHDYYHTYTVDEHILTAIRNLEQVWEGRTAALASLSLAMRSVRKRWVLLLAILLHDLGKAFRSDHERRGRVIAGNVLDRLGISDDDRDRVLFLVEHHLLMAVLSQRRELDDQKVVADFIRVVGDRENLQMLYLLTYADMSAVGPATWTNWKATLLQDLYLRSLDHFDTSGAISAVEHDRIDRVYRELIKIRIFTEAEVASFLRSMPLQYLLTASVSRITEHLRMIRRLPDENIVISHRHLPERGYTELTVCAYDAYGMFFRTVGTITAQNLSILRAQVYTARNGIMIDTFQITGPDGFMTTYEETWGAIEKELADVLTGRKQAIELHSSLYKRKVHGNINATVSFDNDTSNALTVIDITARDRIGLLYLITKTLYDLNINITSAKIVTEGVRAMDSFYVSDLLGSKITDTERLNRIRDALMKVLS